MKNVNSSVNGHKPKVNNKLPTYWKPKQTFFKPNSCYLLRMYFYYKIFKFSQLKIQNIKNINIHHNNDGVVHGKLRINFILTFILNSPLTVFSPQIKGRHSSMKQLRHVVGSVKVTCHTTSSCK